MHARFARTREQLSLGQIIARLEAVSSKDAIVSYDFGHMFPSEVASYRGSYAELAFGYEEGGQGPYVTDFLERIKGAVGKTYQGYKGGDFTMGLNTPVWVANWGSSGATAIVDVLTPNNWEVILITEYCEFT